MKTKLCLFEGNCVSDKIFYLFLIPDHSQKCCFLYAIYGHANKKEVVSQMFVAMRWLKAIWKNISAFNLLL